MPTFFLNKALNNFYVFEGIDGVGKSLQMSLAAKLLRTKFPVYTTQEPTNTPIGTLIRGLFTQGIQTRTLAMLFAADRNEHVCSPHDGIYKKCRDGFHVLCDRYVFSSLVYQGVDIPEDAILELNRYFPLPEHLFFLDLPPEICLERIKTRTKHDFVETLPMLRRARERYLQLLDRCANSEMHIHYIDARIDAEETASHIINIILSTDT